VGVITFTDRNEAVMPEKTEQELRAAFYYNVICTEGTKRFVATSDLKNDSQKGAGAAPMQIFVPEIDSEYDLVLSLCQDGTQRITVDWDQYADTPLDAIYDYDLKVRGVQDADVKICTPSTSNWHLWGTKPVHWGTTATALLLVDNEGYYTMNSHKGFCALRPPWKLKNNYPWNEYNRRHPNVTDGYAGFDWSQANRAEDEKPKGESWDDLGWDDD
jgi:hypothetical protein